MPLKARMPPALAPRTLPEAVSATGFASIGMHVLPSLLAASAIGVLRDAPRRASGWRQPIMALKRNAILRGCKSIAWSLNRRRASFEASLREHLRMTSFPELSEVCRHSEERCGIAAARLEPRTKPMQSKLSRPDESAKRGISQDAPRR